MKNKSAEIEKLKEQVKHCLEEFSQARNCDKFLTWAVWKNFYGCGESIDYIQYLALPAPGTIARIRRYFQNNETNPQYLPTIEAVAKQRKINIEIWKNSMQMQTAFTFKE